MTEAIKRTAHRIINEIYSDLEAACAEFDEQLDAESLADSVGDRLHDELAEYGEMPYTERRAIVMSVCKQYC
jgi:DNA-binding GntR family transcriptional regulator